MTSLNAFPKRVNEFERNVDLENFLKEINLDLKASEEKLLEEEIIEYPIVFIMGAMRSGTTLLEQWLADTGEFAYPSNIMSRFYGAPIIGSKIQRLLTDPKYNFRNEIVEFQSNISFNSNNGKTQGALEPNEFWYFWRRFLPEDVSSYSDEELLKSVDIVTLKKEMWGIAQTFNKPLALKGMICNYNIGFLNEIFSKAIFVWIQRDITKNTQSVLEARRRQYGTDKEWYSFMIPEYEELIKIQDMQEQVRKQIVYMNRAIESGLQKVSDNKKLCIKYENFCDSPSDVYQDIYIKLKEQGFNITEQYKGVKQFSAR